MIRVMCGGGLCRGYGISDGTTRIDSDVWTVRDVVCELHAGHWLCGQLRTSLSSLYSFAGHDQGASACFVLFRIDNVGLMGLQTGYMRWCEDIQLTVCTERLLDENEIAKGCEREGMLLTFECVYRSPNVDERSAEMEGQLVEVMPHGEIVTVKGRIRGASYLPTCASGGCCHLLT